MSAPISETKNTGGGDNKLPPIEQAAEAAPPPAADAPQSKTQQKQKQKTARPEKQREPTASKTESAVFTSSAVNDSAAVEDEIGFRPYVGALSQMILHKDTSTPITVGLYGRWGSGKSSFMAQVDDAISDPRSKEFSGRDICSVWFEAWKYQNVDELSSSLMSAALSSLEKTASMSQKLRYRLRAAVSSFRMTSAIWNLGLLSAAAYFMQYEAQWKVLSALPIVGMMFNQSSRDFFSRLSLPLGIDPKSIFDNAFSTSNSVCVETFSAKLENYLHAILGQKGRLVVFIDDLDRCSPKHVVSVLETLNVLMDAKGCIFILGIDHEKVVSSVEAHYNDIASRHNASGKKAIPFGHAFLEKIVQLPIRLPQIHDIEVKTWAAKMLRLNSGMAVQADANRSSTRGGKDEPLLPVYKDLDYPPEIKEIVQQLLVLIEPRSPRLIKRYLNRLRFSYLLYRSNKKAFSSVKEKYLPVWLLLSENAHDENADIMRTGRGLVWRDLNSPEFHESFQLIQSIKSNTVLTKHLDDFDGLLQSDAKIDPYIRLIAL